jgi:divalent metal cation (Fe/Co/Zn/Cd) transporter
MVGFSRDETASVTILGITVAVLTWYRTDLTGIHRWTDATIALLVSVVVATATFYVLNTWDPVWYRS